MALYIRRVLIVDGDAADLAMEVASLRTFGRWTVFVAAAAEELLRSAKRDKPDVIPLGSALPDGTPKQLAAILAADAETAALPLVLMADGPSLDISELGRAIGARGVIRKPVGPVELPDQVRAAIGASSGASPDVLFRNK